MRHHPFSPPAQIGYVDAFFSSLRPQQGIIALIKAISAILHLLAHRTSGCVHRPHSFTFSHAFTHSYLQTVVVDGSDGTESLGAAIDRAALVIERTLLKAAAIEDARNAVNLTSLRRLLAEDQSFFENVAEFNDEEEDIDIYNDRLSNDHHRHLLKYNRNSAVRPSATDALPYCAVRYSTEFLVDPSRGLRASYVANVTTTGDCCAACLFRKDCFAWTLRSDGCYLRPKGHKTIKVSGITSGVMRPSATYRQPLPPRSAPLPRGRGKYASTLLSSSRFYQAQRSGPLPSPYSIAWRASSHLNDTVVGGWYDASQYMKASFPMTVAVSFLAWSMVTFPGAFKASGAQSAYLSQLRVANDYLLATYNEREKTVVGQIGYPDANEAWGRADQVNDKRTAFMWDSTMHGSDLLSNYAAAFAASSIVFGKVSPSYAATLKAKAKSIYSWAKNAEGKYSDYYKSAVYTAYPSSSYLDSQAWAAGWLFRASGNPRYLSDAASFWSRSYGQDHFSADVYAGWDSLWAPTAVLMRQIARKGHKVPGITAYNAYYSGMFLPAWVKADGTWSITRTPKGMTYPSWNIYNNLGYATTVAMVMLQDLPGNQNTVQRNQELAFAKRNIDYALGSAGRSYVLRNGNGPPHNARHAGASCPARPYPCDIQNLFEKAEDPQPLSGGMVGGPAGRRLYPRNPDAFVDDRSNIGTNEPSVINNAGLAGALAGMWAYSK